MAAAEDAADRSTDGGHWLPRAPAEWLKGAVSATTALGVVTYAVLRFDYGLFYDRFGLKPEDVGLGQADLISQSVSGVVLVLVVFFIEFLLIAGALWFLRAVGREAVRSFRETRRNSGTLAAIASGSVLVGVILGALIGGTPAGPWLLLALGPVAVGFLWWISHDSNPNVALLLGALGLLVFLLSDAFVVSRRWTLTGTVGLLVVAIVSTRWSAPRSRKTTPGTSVVTSSESAASPDPVPPAHPPVAAAPQEDQETAPPGERRDRGRLTRTQRFVLVGAVVLTVALTETTLALSAVSDADFVRSGHAVEPRALGIPIVSWGARAVDVVWEGQPPAGGATLLDHCFLYLGQADGTVLLYDHDDGGTIRVPSSAVVLSIRPAADYERVCPK